MAESDPLQQLVHERLDRRMVELASIAARVHVFLQVLVHVFEDEHQFVFRVNDIVEGDDVFMLEFFHERDFSDRRRWRALFRVQVDFFECDQVARLTVASFEDLERIVSGAERKLTMRY